MGTTIEKLNKILQTKEAIRTAINNKGVIVTETDKFSDYAEEIDNISKYNPLQYLINNRGGDGKPSCRYLFRFYKGSSLDNVITKINTKKADNMSYMFCACENLTTIPQFSTNSCTNMSYMFEQCRNLTTIPEINTSVCTDMSYMFSECSKLITIPQLDTSKVINMKRMFNLCYQLTIIPSLNTDNVTNMELMFNFCHKLTKIDMTSMNKNTILNGFACCCYSLKKLIIRNMDSIPELSSDSFYYCYHFNGTISNQYNPSGLKDGRIYVPDDKVEELKTATN